MSSPLDDRATFPQAALAALEVATMEVRLGRCLAALRAWTGAAGAALVEFDARDGRLRPRVRVASGLAGGDDAAVPEASFVAWLDAPGEAHALDPLGGGFVGQVGRVLPLEVRPRWWSRTDAALCLTGDAPPPAEVIAGLAAALSADRDERSARILRAALEQSVETVELTDTQVRVVYVNAAFERLFGYGREEVVGDDLLRLRDPEAQRHDPLFYRFAEESVNQHGSWISTLGSRRRDGRSVMTEIVVSYVDAPELRFRGNLGMRRDLQHRAARDVALALAHREIRVVLGALPLALAVVREGQIYFGNAAFFAVLGVAPESVVSSPLARFVHPDERPRLDDALRDGAVGLRVTRPDGSVRIVDVRTAGEISFEGHLSRILVIDDTTDRQFRQATDAQANRLAALGALAASVAHEINNPLAVVTSNLEWLIDGAIAGEHRETLQDTLDGARRIRRIVADLKAFSRSDGPARADDTVDVARALAAAFNLTANELRHAVAVEQVCPAGVVARGKDGPLVQVLVNLVMNASQAMRGLPGRSHRLRVEVALAGPQVEIAVADTGPGISAALRSRLFAPFVTTRGDAGGTGLGLWISRRIVEGFGGTLTVDDGEGPGAVFRVRLPRAETLAPPLPSRPPAPAVEPCGLVVIDDDVLVGRALSRLLQGHRVESFDDSRQGLERLLAGPIPDVVLCDLMMPDLHGAEVYEAACAARPELRERFVFVTGGAFTEETAAFLARCHVPVVAKPFDADEVRAAVDARRPTHPPPARGALSKSP